MAYGTGGAFNELEFLTNIPILYNDDNRDTIFNSIRGELDAVDYDSNPNNTVIFKKKEPTNTSTIKNYYKDTVYKYSGSNESDLNPYLKLIRDFEDDTFNAVRLQAADFAYLTDLGVYPMNRLWILRRFNDSVVVPDNLTDFGGATPPYATQTMVGWIDTETDNFFNISYNEVWTAIDQRLDQVLMKIIEDEFGMKMGNVVSLPGWSQGLLMGFLNEMGLTDYDMTKVPQGDPAVLQEAATRAKDSQPGYSNKSTMTMTLKTSYEQKFINDIDPGNAMLDLIQRAIYMGTRDTKYVFTGTGEGSSILTSLRKAANSNSEDMVDNWWNFIVEVVDAFLRAIEGVVKAVKGAFFEEFSSSYQKISKYSKSSKSEGTAATQATDQAKSRIEKFKNIGGKLLQSILASTVGKWRYALLGSIALMTGENTTPWHLTLGNPYSPFVSLGNIIVDGVDMKFNNEFAFNDIPTRLDVEIKIRLGRNLGAQEIFRMFNNGYMREYLPKPSSGSGGNTTSERIGSESLSSGGKSASSPKRNEKKWFESIDFLKKT